MSDSKDNQINGIDREILTDCSQRILDGDPNAGFDLAIFVLGELPSNEAELSLAVIEGLIRQSAQLGSSFAKEYLEESWPAMRNIMIRRLKT